MWILLAGRQGQVRTGGSVTTKSSAAPLPRQGGGQRNRSLRRQPGTVFKAAYPPLDAALHCTDGRRDLAPPSVAVFAVGFEPTVGPRAVTHDPTPALP